MYPRLLRLYADFSQIFFQNQLYDLFELTERQRRCKADLELQLSKLRHNNALDEALELQV